MPHKMQNPFTVKLQDYLHNTTLGNPEVHSADQFSRIRLQCTGFKSGDELARIKGEMRFGEAKSNSSWHLNRYGSWRYLHTCESGIQNVISYEIVFPRNTRNAIKFRFRHNLIFNEALKSSRKLKCILAGGSGVLVKVHSPHNFVVPPYICIMQTIYSSFLIPQKYPF